MTPQEIDKEIIEERMDVIQKSLQKLRDLKDLSAGKFMLDDNFAIAEHNLGDFDIFLKHIKKIIASPRRKKG